MPFPFPNLWPNHHLDDAIDRIDRHLGDRAQRLFAGISVASDFGAVHGVLMSSRGRGKFLRVNQVLREERQVPRSISDSLRALTMDSGSEVTRLAQATADLAVVQAEVIEELKIQAGKYVDRLLTVAVDDPGHWSQDFDGQVFYSSLCDRHRLSELCGLNVIDAFPARDLAVGGNGQILEALPLWILLADRNERVARRHVAVFRFGVETRVFLLPPSDGLDADMPQIRCLRLPGFGFVRKLLKTLGPSDSATKVDFASLYVDGKRIPQLIDVWTSQLEIPERQSLDGSYAPRELDWEDDQLVEATTAFLGHQFYPLSSVIRSALAFVIELVQHQIKHRTDVPAQERPHLDRIWIAADDESQAPMINLARQTFVNSEIETTLRMGLTEARLSAVVAALLGLMFVDQMAGNVPWITGASRLRTLGSLTPGRPGNWRQLIMDMADFHPPAMKLKDAI